MRLSLLAVGRLKSGPERELVERYRQRIDGLGRSLGEPGRQGVGRLEVGDAAAAPSDRA